MSNYSSFYEYFWSFFANPFNIFHKTEVLLVLLNYYSLSFVKDIKGLAKNDQKYS